MGHAIEFIEKSFLNEQLTSSALSSHLERFYCIQCGVNPCVVQITHLLITNHVATL